MFRNSSWMRKKEGGEVKEKNLLPKECDRDRIGNEVPTYRARS